MGQMAPRTGIVLSICAIATLLGCTSNQLTKPVYSTRLPSSETLVADNINDVTLLYIDGLVETALKLNYEDFTKLYPAIIEDAVLYCPGVYENQPSREWFGVPVSALISSAGLKPEASRLIFYANDGYKTVISIEKINETGAILAFQVDGATLSEADGYPFRLVSNDLIGDVWIKSVHRIEIA
jgi:DMSO/TMAO reductase YedYZ molybdopterin-dependent catalytic subunit